MAFSQNPEPTQYMHTFINGNNNELIPLKIKKNKNT